MFTITNDDQDYGIWQGADAADALRSCLHDTDRTRVWEIERLSDNPNFGSPARTENGNGNGGQDRSRYWYVAAEGRTAVFTAVAANPFD